MAEFRLEKHCRAQYLTDFSYSWDTSYNRLLLDEDLPTKVRHNDYTSLSVHDCGGSDCGTNDETVLIFILPWKNSFHDVIDGVCRGSVYIHGHIAGVGGTQNLRYYVIVDIVTVRESDGNITSLASYTSPTESLGAGNGDEDDCDVQYPFFLDVDNALVDENHRVGLRIRSYARHWGSGSWTGACYLRLYHTFNEDETFIYLKYV